MKRPEITLAEFVKEYYRNNPKGHFFDRKNMSYGGDTMKNFRLNVIINNGVEYYMLTRKKISFQFQANALIFTMNFQYKCSYHEKGN